jgi:hypothetical protein
MTTKSNVSTVEKLEVPTVMKAAVMNKPFDIEIQEVAEEDAVEAAINGDDFLLR